MVHCSIWTFWWPATPQAQALVPLRPTRLPPTHCIWKILQRDANQHDSDTVDGTWPRHRYSIRRRHCSGQSPMILPDSQSLRPSNNSCIQILATAGIHPAAVIGSRYCTVQVSRVPSVILPWRYGVWSNEHGAWSIVVGFGESRAMGFGPICLASVGCAPVYKVTGHFLPTQGILP